MADDALWKRRFHIFMLVRLAGLATFFLGLAIIYSDLLRPGGWPAVGAIIVVIGVVDAALAPRMLKKLWAQQDAANK